MRQSADAGPGLGRSPVAAARAAFDHEARLLEGEADEAIGQRHAVIAADEVVEVADVEAAVGVAIQAEKAPDLGPPRFAGGGQPAAIIEADHLVGPLPGAPAAPAPGVDG